MFTYVGPATGVFAAVDAGSGAAIPPYAKVVVSGTDAIQASVPDGAGGWFLDRRFSLVGGEVRQNRAPGNTVVYAGGLFTNVGGQPRNRIAALAAGTGLATAWNPNASGSVNALAVDAANVYAGGSFITIGGASRTRLAQVDRITGLATAWNPGPNNNVLALALKDSTLYVGGDFLQMGTTARARLAAAGASPAAHCPSGCRRSGSSLQAAYRNFPVRTRSGRSFSSRHRRQGATALPSRIGAALSGSPAGRSQEPGDPKTSSVATSRFFTQTLRVVLNGAPHRA